MREIKGQSGEATESFSQEQPGLGWRSPRVTVAMLTAGVAAYRRWDPAEEEIESLVASIFWEMAKESPDFLWGIPP